jgi:probable DNA metabolism protein
MTYLLYDGTFAGFLTAVGDGREGDSSETRILSKRNFEPDLFSDGIRRVETDEAKVAHIAAEIVKRMSGAGFSTIHYAFLSERPGIEDDLAAFIRRGFAVGNKVLEEWYDRPIRGVLDAARRAEYEYHRFLGLLRFEKRADSSLYAAVRPDNNIIELLGGHFRERFPRLDWIIHDVGRRSAVVYSGGELGFCPYFEKGNKPPETPDPEKKCQALWKIYCDIIAVPQRRNPKLQRHFLPNKYRDTLTEMKGPHR